MTNLTDIINTAKHLLNLDLSLELLQTSKIYDGLKLRATAVGL